METNESIVPAPRLPLSMDIEYRRSYARQSESGVLRNISLTGAFLEADVCSLGPKDKIVIKFTVSGRERKIHASVIWKNDGGCGLKFHPFNNRDVQIVDDLMYFVETKRKSRKTVLENIFTRLHKK